MSESADAPEAAPEEDAKPKVENPLVLREPVEMGEERITQLKFRRPRAGDMMSFPADGSATIGHVLDLASRLTGQPLAALKKLCLEDLNRLSTVINSF
jgi:hypothetical protein